eukprot:m.108969 g.108969  ORF g.108969 m.108969 type:complete len:98 (+) comp13988_c1_seq1:1190-1483(+)
MTSVIENVISGECAGSAITTEDLQIWMQRANQPKKCQLQFATAPIARRYRAMMTKLDLACVVTAVNAIFQDFLLRTCTSGMTRRSIKYETAQGEMSR